MSEACEEAESDQGRSTRAMSPDGGALEQSDPSRLGDGGAGGDPQLDQYVCHMAVEGVLADRELSAISWLLMPPATSRRTSSSRRLRGWASSSWGVIDSLRAYSTARSEDIARPSAQAASKDA